MIGLVLDSTTTSEVAAPVDTAATISLRIVATSVPVPTLVAGRPQ
jgi:hypothetical protein